MKKKIYTIGILLLIAVISGFAQQIKFFHIGPEDKPMEYVIISTQEIESEFPIVDILVTDKEYEIVKKYVIRKNTHKQPPADIIRESDGRFGGYGFGCYAVQIMDNKDGLLYFMDTNEESVRYFKEFVRFLDKKNLTEIAEPFQTIIDRSQIIFVDEEGNEVVLHPRNQYKYWIIGGIGCCFLIFLLIVKFKRH
ncbi:MAG: hypothetical protein LBO74_08870 [Candidatus Symbiothrix sp.]|jgi:hypothetical protein|nr:hypothetical protein [Candidatus Symbiothrix sp.]